MSKTNSNNGISESPPFFKKWKSIYFLVVGFLALCIAVFYIITMYFNYKVL
jgi:hypothetical protein